MKKSVYLDTTIFSYLVDERESIRNFIDVTKEWWETQRENYDTYLSIETLAELREGDYPRKEKATRLAETIEVLPRVYEIEEIAEIYIKNYCVLSVSVHNPRKIFFYGYPELALSLATVS